MKYQIETEYAWYDTPEGSKVILVYMIQNVPFTFDELPEIARNLPEVVKDADESKRWSTEEMYRASMYLMMEECHPMMYELEIENPRTFTCRLMPTVCSVVEQGFCKRSSVQVRNLVGGTMKINLWYSKSMEQWRWTLCEEFKNGVTKTEQHSGQQPMLRDAMNDVANTVEYILEERQK